MKIPNRFARFAWPVVALATVLTVVGVVPRFSFSRDGAIWSERAPGSAPVAMTQAPAWVEIAKTVKPAVVNVSVRGVERKAEGPAEELMERFGRSPKRTLRGMGTGFVINADGYVVTNNHVVDGASEIRVKFSDGRELVGKVVGQDEKTDLALVKVEATGPAGDPDGRLVEAGSGRARDGDRQPLRTRADRDDRHRERHRPDDRRGALR